VLEVIGDVIARWIEQVSVHCLVEVQRKFHAFKKNIFLFFDMIKIDTPLSICAAVIIASDILAREKYHV